MFKKLVKNHGFEILALLIFIWLIKTIPYYKKVFDPFNNENTSFDIYDIYYSKIYNASFQESNDIIIVDVGNLDRKDISSLIDSINSYRPKVIGVDIIFPKDSDSTRNENLEQVMKKYQNIVTILPSQQKENHIVSNLRNTGPSNLISEDHYTIRQFEPNQEGILSFPLRIVELYNSKQLYNYLKKCNEIEIIDYSLPNIRRPESNIYEHGSILTISGKNILKSSFPRERIQNKIVLMGYISKNEIDIEDKYFTPFNKNILGRSLPDLNGVQIHANTIESILRNEFIRQIPLPLQYIIIILILHLNFSLIYKFKEKYPIGYQMLIRLMQLLELLVLFFFVMIVYHYFRLRISIDIFILSIILFKETYEIMNEELIPFLNKFKR